MRKFFIIISFIICFIMVGFCKYDEINFAFNECANPKYYFYVTLSEECDDVHYTKNGNGGIIALNENELHLLNDFKISKMYGKSIQFEGDKNSISKFLKDYDVSVVKEENFESFSTVYGYNAKFGDCVTVGDDKINIQLAVRDNIVNIGFPLLLGSF
ncbi:MAG: hypothetical protein ACI4TX_02725 [Christensenellales bacterium]